jgi:ketol-acid reductoisomerase
MQGVLDRIQDGSFARKWMDETKQCMPRLKELRAAEAAIPIEKVSAEIRRRLKRDPDA